MHFVKPENALKRAEGKQHIMQNNNYQFYKCEI
jgi:hypothetical protein